MSSNPFVRIASDADLACILGWLREEWVADGCREGIWNNRNLIAEAHEKRSLLALIEQPTDSAVGLCVGGLTENGGLFAIRSDVRRSGRGTTLFEHCLAAAKLLGKDGLRILMTPDSESFWEKCGFQKYQDLYAALPIEYPGSSFDDDEPKVLSIELFDESGGFIADGQRRVSEVDGEWVLESSFARVAKSGDWLIELTLDGRRILRDKVKRRGCGVQWKSPIVQVMEVYEEG